MRSGSRGALAFTLVALVAGGCGGSPGAVPRSSEQVVAANESECFYARADPIYQGYGWTHFVDVVNLCTFDLVCEVATSVDPAPVHVLDVAAGTSARVRTRYGSNTPLYRPIVACAAGSTAGPRHAGAVRSPVVVPVSSRLDKIVVRPCVAHDPRRSPSPS